MEADRFDLMTRALAATSHRRQALLALVGGSLGLLGLSEADAKRKKKKCKKNQKKCGKKCVPASGCCADSECTEGRTCQNGQCNCPLGTALCPGKGCVAPAQCGGTPNCPSAFPKRCPVTTQDPEGLCVVNSDVCCNSAQGGGSCDEDAPTCCPISDRYPGGTCATDEEVCCPSNKGGQVCLSEADCCIDNGDCTVSGETCQNGCCDVAQTCDTTEDCDNPLEECVGDICVSICDALECACECARDDDTGDPVCVTLQGDCDFPCSDGCPTNWICVDDGLCGEAHCHPPCGSSAAERQAATRQGAARVTANAPHRRRTRAQRSGNRGRNSRQRGKGKGKNR